MSIGKRISDARKQKGFTQEYLAQRLEVSRQAVSKWEKGLTAPNTHNLITLAELLGVSVDYLTRGEVPVQLEEKRIDPRPFRRTSRLFFWPGFLMYLYGVFSGVFNRMVMVPFTPRGDAIGIPFLYYGTAPFSHGLLIASVLCLTVAFIFRVVGYYISINAFNAK